MPRHFGILVPSTNTTCEIEFCRLPAELQVHTGRLGKGGCPIRLRTSNGTISVR